MIFLDLIGFTKQMAVENFKNITTLIITKARGYRNIIQFVVTDCQKKVLKNFI